MKKLVLKSLIALFCALPSFANAGLLVGDDVTVAFNYTTSNDFVLPGTIGPGADAGIGNLAFDLNAGPGGDVFEWIALSVSNIDNVIGITVSDLAFDDGSDLIDFNLFSTVLSNLAYTISAASIAFTFDEFSTINVGAGTVLSGQFITPTTTVPEPGTLALLMLGLVGMRLRCSA